MATIDGETETNEKTEEVQVEEEKTWKTVVLAGAAGEGGEDPKAFE
jgi:hypothetical protein